MNLVDMPNLGKSGNALPHNCSLIITVINLLDCNRPSGPSVNNTALIGLYWYSNTFAVKDRPKLSYKTIYLILDIQWKVRQVELFTQLVSCTSRLKTDKKIGSTEPSRLGAGCSNLRSKGPPLTLCRR